MWSWLRNHERVRASLFLGLSFAMALIAGLLVWGSIAKMKAEIALWQTEDPHVTVIVAAHTLGQGHPIGTDDILLRDVPRDYVANSVLRDPARVLSRVPAEPILAGDMIREERLADAAAGPSMAALIPRGMRAITVDLDNGASVSGFLDPGNTVDVLITMRDEDGMPAETVTLMQAVRVLSVDDRMGARSKADGKARRPAVTLLVTPLEAEQLSHGVAQGIPTLTLRNAVDVGENPTHGARETDLLGTPSSRMDIGEYRRIRADQDDGSTLFIRGQDERRD